MRISAPVVAQERVAAMTALSRISLTDTSPEVDLALPGAGKYLARRPSAWAALCVG
jgi:hypothetical protein